MLRGKTKEKGRYKPLDNLSILYSFQNVDVPDPTPTYNSIFRLLAEKIHLKPFHHLNDEYKMCMPLYFLTSKLPVQF